MGYPRGAIRCSLRNFIEVKALYIVAKKESVVGYLLGASFLRRRIKLSSSLSYREDGENLVVVEIKLKISRGVLRFIDNKPAAKIALSYKKSYPLYLRANAFSWYLNSKKIFCKERSVRGCALIDVCCRNIKLRECTQSTYIARLVYVLICKLKTLLTLEVTYRRRWVVGKLSNRRIYGGPRTHRDKV